MALITVQDFIALRGPQFSSDPRLTDFITLATSKTNSKMFPGLKYNEAIALRVLHYLELERLAGTNTIVNNVVTNVNSVSAGAVISESEGDMSREYSFDQKTIAKYPDLIRTNFGCELIQLIKSCILPLMVG